MKAEEFITLYEKTVTSLGIRELINKADDELSGGAAQAITYFIGHDPGKIDTMDHDDEMAGFGIMGSSELESNKHAREIENAFMPVRNQLKKQLGDTVKLYRAQHDIENDAGKRNYLSWTSDSKFARWHAGVRKEAKPLYTEQDIKGFENKFNQHDIVKITGTNYTLKKEHHKMYNIYDELVEFDSIDIYNGNEHLTDTESVREFIEQINKDREEYNIDNDKKAEKILTAEVAMDDVIWVSDRAGQSEFIVKNYPGSSAYIDSKGILVK